MPAGHFNAAMTKSPRCPWPSCCSLPFGALLLRLQVRAGTAAATPAASDPARAERARAAVQRQGHLRLGSGPRLEMDGRRRRADGAPGSEGPARRRELAHHGEGLHGLPAGGEVPRDAGREQRRVPARSEDARGADGGCRRRRAGTVGSRVSRPTSTRPIPNTRPVRSGRSPRGRRASRRRATGTTWSSRFAATRSRPGSTVRWRSRTRRRRGSKTGGIGLQRHGKPEFEDKLVEFKEITIQEL